MKLQNFTTDNITPSTVCHNFLYCLWSKDTHHMRVNFFTKGTISCHLDGYKFISVPGDNSEIAKLH